MRYEMRRAIMKEKMESGMITRREYRNFINRMKRQRIIHFRIMMAAFSVCLVVCLAVSYGAIVSNAETKQEALSFKYYKQIEVQYNDTLWSIAEKYADSHYDSRQDYIREVKSINHLRSDMVKEGQKLVVPYYSEEFVY